MLKAFAISIAVILQRFPLRPEPGSTIAAGVDRLHFFLTALTLFFTITIFSTILYFAIQIGRAHV